MGGSKRSSSAITGLQHLSAHRNFLRLKFFFKTNDISKRAQRGPIFMKRTQIFTMLMVVAIFACVTVNVYFPEAAVQQAADKFVEKVKKQAGASDTKKDGATLWLPLIGIAHAEQSIRTDSPRIKALEQKITENYGKLLPYIQGGTVFEADKGYLESRGQLDARTLSLLNRHNADRKEVYMEILKHNNLPTGDLDRIERIFGRSWKK